MQREECLHTEAIHGIAVRSWLFCLQDDFEIQLDSTEGDPGPSKPAQPTRKYVRPAVQHNIWTLQKAAESTEPGATTAVSSPPPPPPQQNQGMVLRPLLQLIDNDRNCYHSVASVIRRLPSHREIVLCHRETMPMILLGIKTV